MKPNRALRGGVVLFLGAGASAPLGKMLMRTFIDHLSQLQHIGLTHLFQTIIKKSPDLEFLLEELGDLQNKGYLDGNSPAPVKQKTFKETAQLAASMRNWIEREVFRHYSSFTESQKKLIKPHFEPLFEALFTFLEPGEPLVVFTTNYDPAIEEFVSNPASNYSLFDGFTYNSTYREEVWSAEAFERWTSPVAGRRDIILIKLHGSTSWFERTDRIVRGPEIYSQGNHISNVLIYPARRKVASDEPFFTAYHLFGQILRSAKCLLAIGYSFRDLDALTRLREATRDNDRLRVGIIDPLAEEIEKKLARHDIPATGLKGTYDPANETNASSAASPPFVGLQPSVELLVRIKEFLGRCAAQSSEK